MEYLISGLLIALLPYIMTYLWKKQLVKYKWSNVIIKTFGATGILVLFATGFNDDTKSTNLLFRIIMSGLLFTYYLYQVYQSASVTRHND